MNKAKCWIKTVEKKIDLIFFFDSGTKDIFDETEETITCHIKR